MHITSGATAHAHNLLSSWCCLLCKIHQPYLQHRGLTAGTASWVLQAFTQNAHCDQMVQFQSNQTWIQKVKGSEQSQHPDRDQGAHLHHRARILTKSFCTPKSQKWCAPKNYLGLHLQSLSENLFRALLRTDLRVKRFLVQSVLKVSYPASESHFERSVGLNPQSWFTTFWCAKRDPAFRKQPITEQDFLFKNIIKEMSNKIVKIWR